MSKPKKPFPHEYESHAALQLDILDDYVRERIWAAIKLHDDPTVADLPVKELLVMTIAAACRSFADYTSSRLRMEHDKRQALGLPHPRRK